MKVESIIFEAGNFSQLIADLLEQSGLIINLASTGCVATKTAVPNLPVHHNEIVDDIAVCMALDRPLIKLSHLKQMLTSQP